MCLFKKAHKADTTTQADNPASVEDLILSGVCEECDQDPTECWLNDYCKYGHTEAAL